MPRSKTEILGEQEEMEEAKIRAKAAEPENIAAKALSHRAQKDIDSLWKRLSKRFALIAAEEVQALLPHIQVSGIQIEPKVQQTRRGIQFTTGKYNAEDKQVKDVVLGAIYHAYVEEMCSGGHDFILTKRENEGGEIEIIEEYLFRERVFALAQSLLGEDFR